jgi:hypothetical protein
MMWILQKPLILAEKTGIAILRINAFATFQHFVRVANFIEFQRAMSNSAFSYLSAGGCVAAASLPRGGQMSGGVVAGVPLQDDGGCATQTGEFAVFGDAELWCGASEHGGGHLFLDDGAEASPGGGQIAGDQNDLRGE